MYEKHFQLKTRPFSTTSRIEQWCEGGNAGAVVSQIRQTLTRGMGIAVLIGAPGLGKSLALEMIARELSDRDPETVLITCSRLDQRRDVLQRILFELNIPCRDNNDSDLRLAVIQHFRDVCRQGRDVLLLIDEAHNLPIELIDELRIVTESAARNQGRCHLVLAGTGRLDDHLNHTDLDTFNQRIACRAYLRPMNRRETSDYVRQHMLRAGGGRREYFDEAALREICTVTGGVPRLVNQVCDQCLIGLAASGQKSVTAATVADAWCDLQNIPRQKTTTTPIVHSDSPENKPPKSSDNFESSSIEFGTLDDNETPSVSLTDTGPVSKPVSESGSSKLAAPASPQNPTVTAADNIVDSDREVLQKTDEIMAKIDKLRAEAQTLEATRAIKAARAIQARSKGNGADKQTTQMFPAFEENPLYEPTRTDSRPGSMKPQSAPPSRRKIIADFPVSNSPKAEESGTQPHPMVPAITPDDDRDMLVRDETIVFDPKKVPVDSAGKSYRIDEPEEVAPPKTGKAVRMDYKKLFSQLRESGS